MRRSRIVPPLLLLAACAEDEARNAAGGDSAATAAADDSNATGAALAGAANGPYLARCPDTGAMLSEACPFDAAVSKLKGPGTAAARYDAAWNACAEHPQRQIDLCASRIAALAGRELEEALAGARAKADRADRRRGLECERDEGACSGAVRGAPDLGKAQASWRSYVDSHCRFVQSDWIGGTGMGSAGAACHIEHAALRIDELRASIAAD